MADDDDIRSVLSQQVGQEQEPEDHPPLQPVVSQEAAGQDQEPDHPAPNPQQPTNVFHGPERVETYTGENEDLDFIHSLMSQQEQPSLEPPLPQVVGQLGMLILELKGKRTLPVFEVEQLGQDDLQRCLGHREWDRAVEILSLMVQEGKAVNGAVDTEADPRDITRAHPELVILLRGHAYFHLRRQGHARRAESYYNNYIIKVYPDGGESTGNPFVDTLLADLKTAAAKETLPRGNHPFSNRARPDRWVNDYLKVYFPEFRHEVDEGNNRVGLLGERVKGKKVRCLVCHKEFKSYSKAKLQYHLLQDSTGKQALCKASTQYTREEINKQVQQDVSANDTVALPLLPPNVQGPPPDPALQDGNAPPGPALQDDNAPPDPALQDGNSPPDHALQDGNAPPGPALQDDNASPDPALQDDDGSGDHVPPAP